MIKQNSQKKFCGQAPAKLPYERKLIFNTKLIESCGFPLIEMRDETRNVHAILLDEIGMS